jgi:TetR/AcrR family transcriptional regulator
MILRRNLVYLNRNSNSLGFPAKYPELVKVKTMVKGKKPDNPAEELKTSILQSARKHFAIHGYSGASLKDIAEEAGVAGSLINYHFKDKSGLFKAAIETFAQDRMAAVLRILGEVRSREELSVRIQLFVEEMMASIKADPYTFDIIDREMRSENPMVMEIFQETMLLAFKSVVEFFSQAKANGLLREDVDPFLAAGTLFSTTCESARKDMLSKRFFNVSITQPEWALKVSRHIVDLFMNGVAK